ncbi:MAG TPA: Holliday junction resolvase RuvX [Pyrinomonadaceae bacterium]|nr:Holliday junction resolvase RuvX [Pyrinomonadaceae bacterium]
MIAAEQPQAASIGRKTEGRLLALDLGTRRVGVAVCDERRLTTRALEAIERRSWKDLLKRVIEQMQAQDACGLVIGLPLNLDGSEGDAAIEARITAEKFRKSLTMPVYLQDERLTTEEAKLRLRQTGNAREADRDVDSEAAAIILQDFISQEHP